jgi:hypothetical protein
VISKRTVPTPLVLILVAAFAGPVTRTGGQAPAGAPHVSPPASPCPSASPLADLDFTLRDVTHGIPYAVLISRDGRICRTYAGAKSKEAVEDGIRALLDLPPPR